jgi:NAD+ synthase (glutamine-hydrolysing)
VPRSLRLALCQINPTVGDLAGNEALILDAIERARSEGAQLVLLPELAVTGYPPEDLLLKEHFLAAAGASVERLAAACEGLVVVVGFPERAEDVFNSAAVLQGGRIRGVYRKCLLPNYGVFDEQRYFQAGRTPALIRVGDALVGLTVCEDIWEAGPPASLEALAGATLLVNISASPYHAGKGSERERMLAQRARDYQAAVAFCALVGGQDELVFDGHSCVLDHTGEVLARAAQFEPELLVCDVDLHAPAAARLRDASHRPVARREPSGAALIAELPEPAPAPQPARARATVREPIAPIEAEIYGALTLGLRDYVLKNGFGTVVLGLSGGIDSALVACVAVDALGPERTRVAIMPSPYSSVETQSDARELAARLGLVPFELRIEEVMEAYERTLAEPFQGCEPDLTEENLQARIRGNLLMALSNKFGWLVLTTSNKSESSVGYTTLYGDMAGGFAVIKDVPKTLVYRLAGWLGARTPAPIPASIIERAPSAELRHDQRDEDSLPPYALLDRILEGYIERDAGRDQLIAEGLPAEVVDRVIRLVDLAEYKRRQAPPGIKITTRAFGRDRRMPITSRYRDGA